MIRNNISILIFLMIYGFSSEIFPSEPYEFVTWNPIEEASGYQIQIKEKKGKVILDKKIEKNYYSVQDIPAGDYLVRSAPLNIFKKPVVWSAWNEMEVLISEIPHVDSYKNKPTIALKPPSPNQSGTRTSDLEIDGENFMEVTEVELTKQDKKLNIVEKKLKSDKHIDVKVDTTNAAPGDYDLTIINPLQKPQIIPKFLKIEDSKKSDTTQVSKDKPLHTYSYPEFMAYLHHHRPKNCPMSAVPEPALSECFQTYVTLNLKTKDSKDTFAFFKLVSDNQQDRISAYGYFEIRCKPFFRPAKERMNEWLENKQGSIDPEETGFLKQAVKKINLCTE